MKIIDAFIFYNELKMLDYRLALLYDIVDYFIIVEATRTHSGNDKPLFYVENKERYRPYNNKIIHIVDNELMSNPRVPKDQLYSLTNSYWKNENHQRDSIHEGISMLHMKDDDYIIISDCDEIPNPNILHWLKYGYYLRDLCRLHPSVQGSEEIACLEQDFYYYNLNCLSQNKWYLSKIVSYRFYKQLNCSPQSCRMYKRNDHFLTIPIIPNGGWHFSYFGSPSFISNKIKQFTHQEFNDEKYTNVETIKKNIEESKDLFFRTNEKLHYIPIYHNNNLPPMHEMLMGW